MIVFRFPALDKGGDDAEVALADVKDERGRSVGRVGTGDGAGAAERHKTIIARTRFAADLEGLTIR